VAFSLNPLLLKLALQQKWSEIRTISRQRFGKLYRPAFPITARLRSAIEFMMELTQRELLSAVLCGVV
jgi:hypothetical protein